MNHFDQEGATRPERIIDEFVYHERRIFAESKLSGDRFGRVGDPFDTPFAYAANIEPRFGNVAAKVNFSTLICITSLG